MLARTTAVECEAKQNDICCDDIREAGFMGVVAACVQPKTRAVMVFELVDSTTSLRFAKCLSSLVISDLKKTYVVTQVWCGLLATQPGKLAPHFH